MNNESTHIGKRHLTNIKILIKNARNKRTDGIAWYIATTRWLMSTLYTKKTLKPHHETHKLIDLKLTLITITAFVYALFRKLLSRHCDEYKTIYLSGTIFGVCLS